MQVIIVLVVIFLVIAIYLLYLYLLFWLSAILFPIGCIALIGVVLFNYVKVVYEELVDGTGWSDSPTGNEPAYKQYYFRKAYQDYWQVVEKSSKKNFEVLEWMKEKGIKIFVNPSWFLTFPLGITYVLVAAAGTIAGFIAYVVFGLLHLTIVLSCAALAVFTAYLLRAVEYLLMAWRRISLKCPHGDCHGDISLPYYICPGAPGTSCGAKHENLLPGSYGVFRRQCQCGAWLPTLFLFGRNRLPGYCPDCNKPLNASLGVTRNIHIPIIGGPSAGKTNFLTAVMMEIHKRAKDGKASIAFPEKKYEKLYEASSRNFNSGTIAGKTVEESPDAFLFNVNTGRTDRLLYIYDAAGELFNQTDKMRRQEYYNYVNGIVFLIDPFSLPQVQTNLEKELSNSTVSSQIKPCQERPQDVYSKLLQTVQQEKGIGRGSINKPIAVVVTKSDAFDISAQIQRLAANQPPPEKNVKHTPESLAVRTWLEKNGEGNLVRGIERDFKNVSYFYCSPLGRLPDTSPAPFSPKQVLQPFNWMLNGYGLDFENGTAKPIDEVKTTTASTFTPKVSTPGETQNGKVIALLWGLSVIGSFIGVFSFATVGFAFLTQPSNMSSTTVTSTPSTPSVVSNKNIKSGVFGTKTEKNQTFEARVTSGTIYNDKIELKIRQTSKNYSGSWLDSSDVIRNSYLVDNFGNRYPADLSQSYGWNNGSVRKGESREGTILFKGNLPAKANQLFLHFTYIPPNGEIIVQIPVFDRK